VISSLNVPPRGDLAVAIVIGLAVGEKASKGMFVKISGLAVEL
jgi:hypothetical protein